MKSPSILLTAALAVAFSAAVPAAVPVGDDFREVIATAKRQVEPAVLYVLCIQENAESGRMRSQKVSGSAFLINAEGEFVTNHHVIDKAKSIRCLLPDGRSFEADCLGSDKVMDVALCKLRLPEGESVPYAAFGKSSDMSEGDFVLALGAPWGLNRTLTFGTISCRNRYIEEHSEYALWLQTDAAIGPGNSGGPLVNTKGEVIGINALGMMTGAAAFGFAIPSEEAQILLGQLREHGKVSWSWSGLLLQPLRDFENDMVFDATNGVVVAGTDPDSPAAKAGLRTGDRILSINGTDVTAQTSEDLPGVRRFFGLLPEGEPIRLSVMRGESPEEVVIDPRAKGAVEGQEREFLRWDFSAKEINQFDTPELYLRRKTGVYVLGTKRGGNAWRALDDEDIILSVDGKPVETLEDLAALHEAALANVAEKHKSLFCVLRSGRRTYAVVDFLKENE